MSDDVDQEQRTEEPSSKRVREFRERGQVAKSRELGAAVVFAAAFALAVGAGRGFSETLVAFMRRALSGMAHGDGSSLSTPLSIPLSILWLDAGRTFAGVVLPFCACAFAVAIAAGLAQVGLPEKFSPPAPRLPSPGARLTELSSKDTLVKLTKQLLRTAALAAAVYAAIADDLPALQGLGRVDSDSALLLLGRMLVRATTWAVTVLLGFGLADYFWQRHRLLRQMRMTKEEQKREMKEEMASPEMKARQRAFRRSMRKNKMHGEVQRADVVLTNPTHYAVALSYQPGKMGAPRVVAKGVDHMALHIRHIAGEAKVPIVENRPLARALYAQVKVGGDIPIELYRAVAEVLAFVYKKRGRRPASAKSASASSDQSTGRTNRGASR